ncbi:MAG: carboxypeptidase regulatory-like domain-containing protein [Planctomycetota bacterium]
MRGWSGLLAVACLIGSVVAWWSGHDGSPTNLPQTKEAADVGTGPSLVGRAQGAADREHEAPLHPTPNANSASVDHASIPFKINVRDLESTPLGGAHVERLQRRPWNDSGPDVWLGWGTTDATGSLEIVDPTLIESVQVRVHAEGYESGGAQLRRGETSSVHLGPGRSVRGQVLERPDGRPLPGAIVRAYDPTSAPTRDIEVGRLATTDADGRFRIGGLPPAPSLLLVASSGGLRPGRAYFETPWPEMVTLHMGGPCRVEGRVATARGEPAPGHLVWLFPERIVSRVQDRLPLMHFLTRNDVWAMGREPVPTAPDGSYVFEGVGIEEPWVVLVSRGRLLLASSGAFTLRPEDATHREDLQLGAPGTLRVRVEGASGQPLEGIQIDLVSARGRLDIENREELPYEQGATLFHDLPPGTWRVRAWPPGSPNIETEVHLPPGGDLSVTLAVPVGGSIRGSLTYPDGLPVPGASVWFVSASDTVMGAADEEGRFALEGLPDEAGTLWIRAGYGLFEARGGFRSAVNVENVRPGTEPVRIVLGPHGRLRGRIAGIVDSELRFGMYSRATNGNGRWSTSKDGRFEFPMPEPAMPVLLRVEDRDGRLALHELPAMDPASDVDMGTLHLQASCELTGIVRASGGEPVADARVLLTERWLDERRTTAADGSFRFTGLPQRPVWVRIDAPGHPTSFDVIELAGVSTRRDLVLEQPGTLRLRVVDAVGETCSGGQLVLKRDADSPWDADLDHHWFLHAWPGGASADFQLAPGPWRVRYDLERQHGERREAAGTFEVRADQTTEVTLTLPSD